SARYPGPCAGCGGRGVPAHADLSAPDLAIVLVARRYARNPARHHRARIGAQMSELRALLADTTERVLSANPDWAAVEEAGLTKVLVPEEQGGFGGTWEDAFIVVRACGAHAIDLPITDAILDSANVNDRDLYGAMMLAAKMAGALNAALELSIEHT